jgi:hypothetical protein
MTNELSDVSSLSGTEDTVKDALEHFMAREHTWL